MILVINFDIDKATIKPESMGTLNMIVGVLKDNPDIKFEIDGHTDNSGTAAHNLTLSQQRADAVKDQLVKMGVDASRLSSKGLGDSKPISDNTTLEGKANNRRVEFVKMSTFLDDQVRNYSWALNDYQKHVSELRFKKSFVAMASKPTYPVVASWPKRTIVMVITGISIFVLACVYFVFIDKAKFVYQQVTSKGTKESGSSN